MKRIHIVGTSPRTGTTLMAEAVKTCFKIDGYSKHEERLFARAPDQSDIFLSKSPKDIMIVGPSLKVDPDLWVICMLRDPRDIISSKHKKDPERYWAGLKFWNTYAPVAQKLKKHQRFFLIRYENFVSHPDRVQNLLCNNIPFLKKRLPFSEYHTAAQASGASKKALGGVRPIKPVSVGKWKKHKERVAGQLELHGQISSDLINFGYETTNKWLNELENISPDISPSHFPEYMTFSRQISLNFGKYLEAFRRAFEQLIGIRIRITHPKKWVSFALGYQSKSSQSTHT